MRTLLSIDLSTTCTGWSLFDIDSKKLLDYGLVKPSTKYEGVPLTKYVYPTQQLYKMINISQQMVELLERVNPSKIVIEEIAGSKNRLGQKVLDGMHFVLWYHCQKYLPIVEYYDVGGANGWRTNLGIKLSEQDRIHNKEAKKVNKTLEKGSRQLPIIDAKDKACQVVNKIYNLKLDPQVQKFDADLGDSICMGHAWLTFRCTSTG